MSIKHTLPADIERTSMSIITEELEKRGIQIPKEEEAVVRRVIHTTADFDYASSMKFTPDAVSEGVKALKAGNCIITDTNMALAGVSKPSLKKLRNQAFCYMAEPDTVQKARQEKTTRAVASMSLGAERHPHAVFAIGNAPTALLRLTELMEEGLRPSMIIAVPVGFVNVVESKEKLFDCCMRHHVPCIAAMGRKGGSNVAAAICNALLYTAVHALDPSDRGWQ